MEAFAERYFNIGDMKSAAAFYSNLMMLHPRYVRMARICRVLADPSEVPQPYRYADVVEALLEPSITPDALFGADTTPASVNKAYQRWTLLVHPDKNPYPKAGDAFNRLVSLRANALELAHARVEHSNSESIGKGDNAGRGNGQHEEGSAPAAQSRSNENNAPSLRAAEIDMTISELKKVQVTLKSLKRKNIDGSELPELSVSLRNIRERRFFTHPTTSLASTAPSIPTWDLAPNSSGSPHTTTTTSTTTTTTTTDTPTNSTDTTATSAVTATNNNNPVVASPSTLSPIMSGKETPLSASDAEPLHQPPQVGAVREEQDTDTVCEKAQSQQKALASGKATSAGREGQTIKSDTKHLQQATIGRTRPCKKTSTDEGTKVIIADERTAKNDAGYSQETTVEKNRSRRRIAAGESAKNPVKQLLEVVPQKNHSRRKTDASKNVKVAGKDTHITPCGAKKPQEEMGAKDRLSCNTHPSEKSTLSRANEQCAASDVQQLQVGLPVSQTVSAASDTVSLVDMAREGINGLIQRLQEIKLSRVPLRLNCDLTIAAYEREKREREAPCSLQTPLM